MGVHQRCGDCDGAVQDNSVTMMTILAAAGAAAVTSSALVPELSHCLYPYSTLIEYSYSALIATLIVTSW